MLKDNIKFKNNKIINQKIKIIWGRKIKKSW